MAQIVNRSVKQSEKAEETEDLRIRRTRKLLQQALIELTVEKGFADVTVRDIAERAMVNRSTFYRHYLDKYELLEQYMDEVFAVVSQQVFEADTNEMKTPPAGQPEVPAGLLALVKHIQQFADFYRVMLGAKGDSRFIQRFRQNAEAHFRRMLEARRIKFEPHAAPIDMRLSYISCADIGAILWWLENDQPCPAEQLAVWMGQMSSASAALDLPIRLVKS